MAKVKDTTDWQQFYWTDAYVSSSRLVQECDSYYSGRNGLVKRAPTLAELEGDDTDYYSTDDTYFEDRRS